MVELYVKLIISKCRTFDQIPAKFQAEVKSKLIECGYNANGDPIVKEE